MILEVFFIVYMRLNVNDKAALPPYCKAGTKDLSMRKLRIILIFLKIHITMTDIRILRKETKKAASRYIRWQLFNLV
ncbi:MAG: hypothetical protein ACFNM7_12625, partial [Prevotella conceptionensis]